MSERMNSRLQDQPPAYLTMDETGRLADNWNLWRTQYEDFRSMTAMDRESSPVQLALFCHTISPAALRVVNGFTYSPDEDGGDW
ncbi:unnamed protein product [Echinostoma caproni]|uniref:AraC family transcriptional regulator n=1 Tax=Echinostoma caproni TaxID=27848 RepID=A0A183AGY3_9TREM|nr:unnamed protein product [Echinostoma caproni]